MGWKTSISKDALLGVGLYTPSEAAAFIHVRPQQLTRWIHGTKNGAPAVRAQFSGHREVVSFLDMVQAMAIRDMRRKKQVPLGRIREGIEWLARYHPEIDYPFARVHKTFILEPQKEIVILLPDDDPQHILQISGRQRGQYAHAKILDKYLAGLEFGANDLANRFIPLQHGHRKIVLDPEIRFGQPRLEPCGYLVETLVDAYNAERSLKRAAWWYEVAEADIRLALRYHESLRGRPYARAS